MNFRILRLSIFDKISRSGVEFFANKETELDVRISDND